MNQLIVTTYHFGEVEVTEDQILTFDQGIPGFEELRKYAMLPLESSAFQYLQSLEDEHILFLTTNPYLYYQDYVLNLTESLRESLHIEGTEEVEVLCIITVPEDPRSATINLMAPLIVNKRTGEAAQFVMHDSPYKTKHPLLVK
ncbi:flagellar assembly protein FliW [Paenibacillus sp. TRM 82003]|nr:flagellar assembly protein FliW [Paenibacillus sp. TRM 82003]MCI3923388.1 flagellar assembly protein FliW [Paenibacillus sp. TRM 82003]